ncbi:MAG TPA: dUTP diphosphatase [Gallionella sp.]|jgi:dimeric dUTPase (all-alpha-NTP-PPase superfamily)|nr:dUTP diphosphatase [Gallionella sp.]OGS68228.1 MAG: dUTP diphosphatase [Gallionellales bacterium GWA2_54_124]OGT31594.1 MAG: dUTP diphosphatase [Gallionellales bacterium RIFOXYD2_FULL_52_7]HCI53924.1 dUTP diphosphatase [Gallionella sp.]
MTLTESQLIDMLQMQHDMNSKVNTDWVLANNNWHRAIQVEGVEAIEHHGWKWWKKQDCDMAQLRMELVDIWHFILSAALQHKHGNVALARLDMMAEQNLHQKTVQFDNQYFVLAQLNLLAKLDLLVGLATVKRTSLALFESLLTDCGMDWTLLYGQYIGKNVLNVFRQDHGYKDGSYLKIWHGREDNEYLVDALEMTDLNASDVRATLYQSLKLQYVSALEKR